MQIQLLYFMIIIFFINGAGRDGVGILRLFFFFFFMSGMGLGYPARHGFGMGVGNHKKNWDENRIGVTHPEPTRCHP